MIELKLEPYCENCAQFEAEVKKHNYCTSGDRSITVNETSILCKNRNLCRNLKNYLKREAEQQ